MIQEAEAHERWIIKNQMRAERKKKKKKTPTHHKHLSQNMTKKGK